MRKREVFLMTKFLGNFAQNMIAKIGYWAKGFFCWNLQEFCEKVNKFVRFIGT